MNKEKYNKGDTIVCQPGFVRDDSSGGAGYENGKVLTVDHLTRENADNPDDIIYWPVGGGNGVYGRAVKLKPKVLNDYQIF